MSYSVEQPPYCDPLRLSLRSEDSFSFSSGRYDDFYGVSHGRRRFTFRWSRSSLCVREHTPTDCLPVARLDAPFSRATKVRGSQTHTHTHTKRQGRTGGWVKERLPSVSVSVRPSPLRSHTHTHTRTQCVDGLRPPTYRPKPESVDRRHSVPSVRVCVNT